MKCPKCGYHSFDHLESCRKCGQDMTDHKAKFNLHGFFHPAQAAVRHEESAAAEDLSPDIEPVSGDVDFGFDFLAEEEEISEEGPAAGNADFDLEVDQDDLNIARPFEIDGESVPADKTFGKKDKDQ
jgi:hypothetical protein